MDTPRSAEEVARRAIALHCVVAVSHGVSKTDILKWLSDEKLYEELSPWERQFIEARENRRRDIIQATWRVEGQVALLWAIRKTEQMDEMTAQCKTAPLVDAIPVLFSSTADFIGSAMLRNTQEIEEEYERIYDIHSRLRNNDERTAAFDAGVVQERHYAMNWITGYCGQAWDEITTDT